MYKNDRWGHRSFQILWPEEEIINVSDKDSKDKTEATLNFVEESLKITKQGNSLVMNKLSSRLYTDGLTIGLGAIVISIVGLNHGLFCLPNLLIMGAVGCIAFSSIVDYHASQACKAQNEELDIELDKVAETRHAIAQFK